MSMGEASGAHAHSRKVGSAKLENTLLKNRLYLKALLPQLVRGSEEFSGAICISLLSLARVLWISLHS